MILKQADDHALELAQLEQWSGSSNRVVADATKTELRIRRAGVKGEADTAYFIDFDYRKTKNWAVIHDLRLEHEGRTAQIDHLLIDRFLECYVLESKYFHAGVKITNNGEFLRWNDWYKRYEGMESPLEQNQRHIAVLRDVMKALVMPTRLGLRLNPEFDSLVLISSSARIDRPDAFDTSSVIKADQLKTRLTDDLDSKGTLTTVGKIAKVVSSETLEQVARLLVSQHQPATWPLPPALRDIEVVHPPADAISDVRRPRVTGAAANTTNAIAVTDADNGPVCKKCQGHDGNIQSGQYGYYFRCNACETNTAIRFTCLPGHHPRLRKAKQQFFRDCPECGSSTLYFTNPISHDWSAPSRD